VITDGVVYITEHKTGVHALEAESGDLIWSYPEEDVLAVLAAPAVADGRVYISGDDGKVYVLDAATGKLEWETTPGVSE
jgi:quinohemoprotein ethanol dehydrogenase